MTDTDTDTVYKYTEHGQALIVLEQTSQGYLVKPVLEYEDGEPAGEGCTILLERVFDSPPVHRVHEEVARLEARCHELEKRENELRTGLKALEKEEKEYVARCSQHAALKHVFDFIAGKITHYVVSDWHGVEILPFEKTIAEYARTKGAKKLLVLFGDSNGVLDWRMNNYADGSGSWDVVQPACSLAEAQALALDAWNAVLVADQRPRLDHMRAALAAGASLPEGYAAKVAQFERQCSEERLKKAAAGFEEAKRLHAEVLTLSEEGA